MSLMTRPQGDTVPDADADNAPASSVYSVHSEANGSPRQAHSVLRNSSSVTYLRQPPNLRTAARRNRKCTECCMTAFGRNRMSAESAHLSTFGAETETEAEIRSTSSLIGILWPNHANYQRNLLSAAEASLMPAADTSF